MVQRYVYMSPSSQIAKPNVVQQQQRRQEHHSSDDATAASTTTSPAEMAGKKRHWDNLERGVEAARLPPLATRPRHSKRCKEEATEDVLAQHFEDVQARATAALEMVQATEQHREQAARLLLRYKALLGECYPSSIARLSRKWVPFKSSDFENADDVILVCRDMSLTPSQRKVFRTQLRRLNLHLTGLVAEVDSSLVLTGYVAKPLTVDEIRWVLREYKKVLTGALLDCFDDVGLSDAAHDHDADDEEQEEEPQGDPSDISYTTCSSD